MKRNFPHITDYITPAKTQCLRLTLAEFTPPVFLTQQAADERNRPLDPTHHLVYFPNVPPASLLLPDGTDSLHSPGPPFTRRMWAGGSMAFKQDILVIGRACYCTEVIGDVQIKGKEGEEKVYVRIDRAIFRGKNPEDAKGLPRVLEQRTLVFMREDHHKGDSPNIPKVLQPIQTPDYSHTMVPTRELLFRFSALTFNAHAIHLDKQFCREVEGHRNLVVHGPLTVVLMIEVLRTHLRTLTNSVRSSSKMAYEAISYVEYRNLAPLYAEEQMKICVKERERENDEVETSTWDVWIEGPDGGYAVKGTVKTCSEKRKLAVLEKPFHNARHRNRILAKSRTAQASWYQITPVWNH